MSLTDKKVLSYFENLYKNNAVYLWGANGETITQTLCDKLFRTYGTVTYNKTYYDNKLKEGLGKIGVDCSGAMFPVSGFDTTAQNYYNKCVTKGNISTIPKDKVCLVFKGKTISSINHVGLYCGNGYVIEMKSSKDNCVKDILNGKGWKYYGIPTWIDYSSSAASSIDNLANNKFIDVSTYQGSVNWNQVKTSGINKVILKIMNKNLKPDSRFEEYYKSCTQSGIDVIGVYNYSYATNVAKAKNDAAKVLSILNGRKTKVWLDVEDDCQKNLGALLIDIINAYQKVIEDAGYEFGIYTGLSFYNSYIKPYSHLINCNDWWIARYYNSYNKMALNVNPNEQYKPNIGKDIYAWQYTSSGQVTGINGNVDVNVLYGKTTGSSNTKPVTPLPSYSETPITLYGKVVTNSGSLMIRSEPNSVSAKKGSYSKNSLIQIIAHTSNGWYRTDKGYISGVYVKGAVGQVYNCGGLNFRTSSDPGAAIIRTLKPSDEMMLLTEENGWYNAKLNDGTIGWVSKKYIRIL